MEVLKKTRARPQCDPAVPPLTTYTKDVCVLLWKYWPANGHCCSIENSQHTESPSTDVWIMKMWYIVTWNIIQLFRKKITLQIHGWK